MCFSYLYSHLQHGQPPSFRNLFSWGLPKFDHWHLTLCAHILPQHRWIVGSNYPSHARSMVPWVCRQIKWPSLCPKVEDVLEQLIPTIFERIPLYFLSFCSRLDKLVLSGAMFMLHLYCLIKASTKSFHLRIFMLSNLIYQLNVAPLKLS